MTGILCNMIIRYWWLRIWPSFLVRYNRWLSSHSRFFISGNQEVISTAICKGNREEDRLEYVLTVRQLPSPPFKLNKKDITSLILNFCFQKQTFARNFSTLRRLSRIGEFQVSGRSAQQGPRPMEPFRANTSWDKIFVLILKHLSTKIFYNFSTFSSNLS